MNNMEFRPDEIVAGKRGEKYPRLKGRLRVLHEDSDTVGCQITIVKFITLFIVRFSTILHLSTTLAS